MRLSRLLPAPLLVFCLGACLGAGAGRLAADPGDVAPAQPVVPARTFNLRDFGAVPDGRTPNTGVFRRAIAAVNAAGGGTLEIPAGRYFTSRIDLCSSLNFHLDAGAVILFSPVFGDYAIGNGKFRSLLLAANAHDVVISGEGVFDGNGKAWWPSARVYAKAARAKGLSQNTSPRPKLIVFDRCQRIRVEGVTLTDSPIMNLMPTASDDVTIENVTVTNPANSPNTDGIDPYTCRRVLVAHCTVDTGDDDIAVSAGSNPGDARLSGDVLVTDCTFLHGHGCSIGSGTVGGLRNMTVRRCTFEGTDGGVRLKSNRLRGGLVENVTYTDLRMSGVGQAIIISSDYMGGSVDVTGAGGEVTATTPRWKGITIRNVVARGGSHAGVVNGVPGMPVRDLVLDNVSVEARTGLRMSEVDGVTLRHVRVDAASGAGIITDDTVRNLRTDGK